jgi:hypothetical protein
MKSILRNILKNILNVLMSNKGTIPIANYIYETGSFKLKDFFILKSGCAKPLALVVMHLCACKNDVSKKIISCPEGKTLKSRGPIPSSVKRPKLPQRVKASI